MSVKRNRQPHHSKMKPSQATFYVFSLSLPFPLLYLLLLTLLLFLAEAKQREKMEDDKYVVFSGLK
ncbi:hypothetical protein Ocin01_02698 [Orchesella cincta]|uniref:Uncharacterized protein n=1 Tax=Orchesella cincta TaxID=48709 RepID=A0A1D2NFD5_ORCCI|nr:hypothetical protein Ocin01_02698 [Orchesella cincta]